MKDLAVTENIENLIYEIRGKQVMLAADVASMYNSETRVINQIVKRNADRFPSDFCFQLTLEEALSCSRSQFVTLNKNNDLRGTNIKYLPYAFTEHGIMMLAALLRTNIAVKVSINIMRAFVKMRRYIAHNNIVGRLNNVEQKIIEHDNKFEQVLSKMEVEKNNHLFFDGQIYDAYFLMHNILETAKKKIIIIDNYIDNSILDILSKTEKKITVITKKTNQQDIDKYNQQYKNIYIVISNEFHDRFIIIDNNVLYHCGASFKDLGNKCFALNKIDSTEILASLLEKINRL